MFIMEETIEKSKVFDAYSRKLLRCLQHIKTLLEEGNLVEAQKQIDELIEDTKTDIES